MKKLLPIFLLSLLSFDVFAAKDPIKNYYVVVDAHGLMCPFLSPMVIERIKSWGPLECERITEEYALRVRLLGSDGHIAKDIENIMVQIGYERDKIHITETIEQ
jgi:hypothetical protein